MMRFLLQRFLPMLLAGITVIACNAEAQTPATGAPDISATAVAHASDRCAGHQCNRGSPSEGCGGPGQSDHRCDSHGCGGACGHAFTHSNTLSGKHSLPYLHSISDLHALSHAHACPVGRKLEEVRIRLRLEVDKPLKR